MAEALHIEVEQVNIKATTEEGLGFTGTGEGISSQAIASLDTIANYSYRVGPAEGGCAGCGGCMKRRTDKKLVGKENQNENKKTGNRRKAEYKKTVRRSVFRRQQRLC